MGARLGRSARHAILAVAIAALIAARADATIALATAPVL
jgi:uncharacterized membrane protein